MNMFCPLRSLFLPVCLAVLSSYVWGEEPAKASSWSIPGVAERVKRNEALPNHVQAEPGQLSLHADFASRKDGVPVYLINRTSETVLIPSQDGDVYLKLEHRNQKGEWDRVQTHGYSFCGNSYVPIELLPEHHLVVSGYMPERGTPAQVRFRTYSSLPLVSNSGAGFFLEETRLAAELDEMALRVFPRHLREMFEFAPEQEDWGRTETEEGFLSALRLASSYVESRYVRNKAERFLAVKKKQEGEETSDISRELQLILKRSWPETKNREALVRTALREVETSPYHAWRILSDLLTEDVRIETRAGIRLYAEIADEVRAAFQRNQLPELRMVVQLLNVPLFAETYFTRSELESWLEVKDGFVVHTVANARGRHGGFDSYAKAGLEAPPHAQPYVLAALASGGMQYAPDRELREPGSDVERRFWVQTATRQPTETVGAFHDAGMRGNRNDFRRILHEPLRAYLLTESRNPSVDVDGWEMGRVVSFVAAWEEKDDLPVFLSLLDHPAAQRSVRSKPTASGQYVEFLRYRVREEARRALVRMGEAVPDDVVLEEERELDAAEEEETGE